MAVDNPLATYPGKLGRNSPNPPVIANIPLGMRSRPTAGRGLGPEVLQIAS